MSSSSEQPRLVDLCHQGRTGIIATWLIDDLILDCGPTSCLPGLLDALDGVTPRALALTHIHLDHAGAAGTLAARFPQMEVWVHRRGAPHLADPSRLIASATRLYREHMDELWGQIIPVPAERIRVLEDGELIAGLRVAETPGHASHHIAYLHEHSGIAFTGDVGGVRLGHDAPVLAPTPPPDIDPDAWLSSIERVRGWHPSAIAPTHFGLYEDCEDHLEQAELSLRRMLEWARELDGDRFAVELQAAVGLGERSRQDAYQHAMPAEQSYAGLRRHLRGTG